MIFNISQVLNKNVYAQQLRFPQFYDRVIALLTRQKSTHEYYYEKKKICCDLYNNRLLKSLIAVVYFQVNIVVRAYTTACPERAKE